MTSDMLTCISTQEDLIFFQSFGLNLVKNCLAADLQPSTDVYYDVYVTSANMNYV